MTQGNAGRGRTKGSRNKKTSELLSLASEGESPAALCLRISQDETKGLETRPAAAKIVMPYIHPRPQPEGPTVEFDLDDISTRSGLLSTHEGILKAVADGEMSIST